MASAGDGAPPRGHVHRFTIPLAGVRPGQQITVRFMPPQVRTVHVPPKKRLGGACGIHWSLVTGEWYREDSMYKPVDIGKRSDSIRMIVTIGLL